MKNVILIGMPGTGKSTVGVILAKRLGYDFIDQDLLICRREGCTLPEIIRTRGIQRFLEIEGAVGSTICCERTVIATGGSAVFSEDAMMHLKKNGIAVWLETPVSVLEQRLAHGSRQDRGVAAPEDMTVADIYAQRAPLYRRYADIRMDCDCDTEGVVQKLQAVLAGQLGKAL